MNDNSPLDIIGIGDTVIDAFIKISIGHTEETAKGTELCLPYGAKVPYDSVTIIPAVGNSANALVSASRLGLKTALVTFLGDDNYGKECMERLEKEKVGTQFITREKGKPTNYHFVIWYGDDRTILVKHTEFVSKLPDIGNPKWIYLSSLGSHTKELHSEITNYMETHPNVKLAFQPGTFQLQLKKELLSLYKEVDIICMNKEEAQELLDIQEGETPKLLDGLEALGPKTIIITDGIGGAYIKDNNKYLNIPLYPDTKPPLERTGAGDAFFSTFISYLAKGKTVEEAIMYAPINSMNVVEYIGAQEGLLDEIKIEEYLKNAPSDYKLKVI